MIGLVGRDLLESRGVLYFEMCLRSLVMFIDSRGGGVWGLVSVYLLSLSYLGVSCWRKRLVVYNRNDVVIICHSAGVEPLRTIGHALLYNIDASIILLSAHVILLKTQPGLPFIYTAVKIPPTPS